MNNTNCRPIHVIFADVLLIALNKNQQYVKAIAASSKRIRESQLPDEPAYKRTRTEL